MGSQLEGLTAMMCVAVVGGLAAVAVHSSDSPMVLAAFAFIGIHLLLAGMLAIPFVCVCVWANLEPPPFAFIWSIMLTVIAPGAIAAFVVLNYCWTDPDSKLTMAMSWVGAIASPFLLLGIGGSALHALTNRKKKRDITM